MFPVLRHFTYVHSVRHALQIVEPFDSVKIVVDTAHVWWEPDLLTLMRANLERIGTVQISNVSAAALDDRRFKRAQLDSGVIPLRDLLIAIDAMGYRGWYEDETLVDDDIDRVQFVRDAREWFDPIWPTDGGTQQI
jgi:sugar phosphate isomerase/epimerase